MSQTHLPSFLNDYDKLKAKGVEVIACVAVNDPFVVSAWGESAGGTGKVRAGSGDPSRCELCCDAELTSSCLCRSVSWQTLSLSSQRLLELSWRPRRCWAPTGAKGKEPNHTVASLIPAALDLLQDAIGSFMSAGVHQQKVSCMHSGVLC